MSEQLRCPKDKHRFWSKVSRSADDDCWPWKGYVHSNGYGRFMLNGKVRQAHRVAYTDYFGEPPAGTVCDHLCRNRSCCNPRHLEPVTHKENILRGVSFSAKNSRKTQCVQGHAYRDGNVYWRSDGSRVCKTCADRRERARKRLQLGWTEEAAYAD